MKKALLIILALALTLSLVACGSGGKQTLKILDTDYAIEDYAICISKDNPELLDKINAALEKLTEEGVINAIIGKYISGVEHDYTFQKNAGSYSEELVMATNATFPPYEFYEEGKIVGIDAEIAAAIADELGLKLTIEDTEFGSIIGGVQTGKYDIGMAGMTVTEERLESVFFSNSYATGIQSVIVIEGGEITSLDDLFAEGAKYVVGVQLDTTGDIYSTDDFGESRVVRYNKGPDAVQALLTGKVDCVIIDNEPAKAYLETNNK
ncbi:transporter substrate-binding domain-containing protein [Clostridiaceae bacterium OttesenSCG-928-D20]|nr:transporter substrate-binding domain-containing protein [Clostridiaceae bacterium OttesenSCG-928-D20]